MLDFMRRKAQSTFIQVTIVAIILVFIFWGVGTNQGTGTNAVAMVNDEPITYDAYQRTYNKRIEDFRSQLGGNIPDGLLETLGLKDQVLDQLIQQALVRQGAAEMGLLVSDFEVQKAIQEMETFKNNGAFDLGWYNQILAGNRMSPEQFEASMKIDLLTGKVLDHLSRFAGVSEAELAERIDFEYRQKKFSYVEIEPRDFEKKIEIKDEELAAFFEEKKDSYRTSPQIKLNYVQFLFEDSNTIEVPEERIAAYYEANKERYVVPEKRRASHILIKVEEGDSEEMVVEKRQKAEGLLKKIREGADLAALARKHSDDKGSGTRGGDLGLFGRGQMVKPFEDAVFSLGKGELTMVRSDFGFHVIRLEAVSPAQVRTIDDVKGEIVAGIRKEQARELVFKNANEAYEKIILSGSLAKYAEAGGVEIRETDFFSRTKPAAELAANPEFQAAAFGLKEGELSSLVEGRTGYAILFAKEIKPPVVPELAAIREQVEKDLVAERARELSRKGAEEMLAAMKAGSTLDAEAGKLGVEVKTSPFLSRANRGGTKLSPGVIDNGLGLTASAPYPENIVSEGNKFYVLAFNEEKDVSEELAPEKKDEVRKKLAAEAQSARMVSWVAFLRDQAEITIDQRF
ncbi:MAG: SurA N-terminal domain-containing protein [Proteobacteria bacterium]|nr:SurA N-terminal domain-containing protein [Pseudomonadota bacterium]MBU1737066.1 SurA N-terminal domain-containing protein [Pseudomonadota bacterium]